MRRSIFALSFFVTTVCFGQTEFGIKTGLNISDIVMTNYINPDVESEFTVKMGLHAGLFMSSVVNEKFGMAAEVVYSNKGFRANPNINLHYITVPLLIQYKLADNIFAEIGPELGYLFSARSDNGNESGIYNNKFDLALDGGFRFNAPRLIFGVRYCAGVFSVREAIESFGLSGNEKIKYQNRVLQLSVGYKLFRLENPGRIDQ